MPCRYFCYSYSYLLSETSEWSSPVPTITILAPINIVGITLAPFATSPTVGQPLVLSVVLANRLLQALVAESHSLTRQISELSTRRIVLENILCDLRREALESAASPSYP
ncbi:flocculation protein FLO11-like [Cucumis melo var. makuwa]|uniref:Flocculation protein FLO11-like n=1 Tax=Cucumis melo var. makuwa TaxID=1194695 RepID=A0A5A7T1L6_CUCMM|nr:flocculation protein FLO11-like [Cucumis melo var. makuwa]TYK27603.1 flocculation protein FLO11-like [Cucumis melo var. makuwa]